jgi:hypothetical protein
MLTKERAERLWELRGLQCEIPRVTGTTVAYSSSVFTHPEGMTADEDNHVKNVWMDMPGYTCWMDAFHRIRLGRV